MPEDLIKGVEKIYNQKEEVKQEEEKIEVKKEVIKDEETKEEMKTKTSSEWDEYTSENEEETEQIFVQDIETP